MAKTLHNDVLDSALDKIATANLMIGLDSQPTSRAQAVANSLADVALTPIVDFTNADGDTSGRKVTIAAKSNVVVDVSGDINHIALCDDDTLLAVTSCDTLSVTATFTVDFPTWDIELADPV